MLDDFIQEDINKEHARVFIGGDDYYDVKSVTDKQFVQFQSRHNKRFKQQLKSDRTDDATLQRIIAPLGVALLVGWKISATKEAMDANFPEIKCKKIDDEKVSVPFSAENARLILSNNKYWEFLQHIIASAKERANFISDELEEDEKNS